MIDLAAAAALIGRPGTERVRLPLETMSQGRPIKASGRILTAEQQPGGGFRPFWSLEFNSLHATCFRLAQTEREVLRLLKDAGRTNPK